MVALLVYTVQHGILIISLGILFFHGALSAVDVSSGVLRVV